MLGKGLLKVPGGSHWLRTVRELKPERSHYLPKVTEIVSDRLAA